MQILHSSVYEGFDFLPDLYGRLYQLEEHIHRQWYEGDDKVLAKLELMRALVGATDIYVVEKQHELLGCLIVKDPIQEGRLDDRVQEILRQKELHEKLLADEISKLPEKDRKEALSWPVREDAIDAKRKPIAKDAAKDLGYNFDTAEFSLFIVGERLRGYGAGTKLFTRGLADLKKRGHDFVWLKTDSWCDYGYYLKRGWKVLSKVSAQEFVGESGNYYVFGKAL